jgi:ribonuclease HII
LDQYNYRNLYEHDLLIEKNGRCTVAGTDEAGRGPLAGPVVAAAVVLNLGAPIHGINDSKKLTPAKRESLYHTITSEAVSWSVGIATVEEIERCNILNASLRAMKRALDSLNARWSLALIDGNREIRDMTDRPQRAITGGDAKSASIAAASIIAKVTRDRIMEEYHMQFPEYGFNAHKGYPTDLHRKKIIQFGLCPVHRKSFCEKIMTQTEISFTYSFQRSANV